MGSRITGTGPKKPYKCPVYGCGKRLRTERGLLRHLDKKHGDKNG